MVRERLPALAYPFTYVVTTSSLTVLLIFAGLAGDGLLAADLAVAQGAVIATFYAFSANARNLILQRDARASIADLVVARIALIVPLCAIAYFLSVGVAGVPVALAGAVIVRRASEWLGEIHLSAVERDLDQRANLAYLATQAGALALLLLVLAAAEGLLLPALWVWALAPLVGAGRRLKDMSLPSLRALVPVLKVLVPHVGSTMIIGVSVYLLRVIIVLVTDRAFAGLLFTAVAIGSFAGTLFANVLGASLAMRGAARHRPRLLVIGLAVFVLLGAALVLAASWLAAIAPQKPLFFWHAVGLSLIGSAVMIEAQRLRLALFDASRGDELFGPDVLRTITLMIATPTLVVIAGRQTLPGVYLLDAVLTWLFYAGAFKHATATTWLGEAAERWLKMGMAVLLVLPLFIQLKGAIYHSPGAPMLDSGGRILNLPLPVSLAACFVGTLLLARFRQAALTLTVLFFLFVGMALTSLLATGAGIDQGSRKLLLLLQFLLPAFALIAGEMFANGPADEELLAKVFFWLLIAFVPAQLLLTWVQGQYVLTHDMVAFSIYQHRQYVPVVFVGAYLLSLFCLWTRPGMRWPLFGLGIAMAVYASVSYSTLALGMLVLGVGVRAVALRKPGAALAFMGAIFVVIGATLWQLRDTMEFLQKYIPAEVEVSHKSMLPENVTSRIGDWTTYGRGVIESGKTLLVGHGEALDRSVSTSAHNFYLDFLYNFGLLAFLPLLALVCYTVYLVFRRRAVLLADPGALGMAFIVLFLIFVDNNFKVNLRQPYPGVFSYFLWGMLLAMLARGGQREH